MKFLKIFSAILFFSFLGGIQSELKAQSSRPVARAPKRTTVSTGQYAKGSELLLGDNWQSPGGAYRLILQSDGDLVLQDYNQNITWRSRTSRAVKLIFDGSLSLIDNNGNVIKSIGGSPDAQILEITHGGNIEFLSADGKVLSTLFRD